MLSFNCFVNINEYQYFFQELGNSNKGLRASQSNNKPGDAAGKTKKSLLDYFSPWYVRLGISVQ